jgi:hypothetical protein
MANIRANRRDMLRAATGFTGASLLGMLGISPTLAAEIGKESMRDLSLLLIPKLTLYTARNMTGAASCRGVLGLNCRL